MRALTKMVSDQGQQNPTAGAAPPLARRMITGGSAIMGGFGVGQVLRLISNLILTRLLAPEAFGLMAVAVSVNVWAVMLTDIGIGSSVIRSHNSDDPAFLRTAWTMKIIRNLFVWAVIAIMAAGVAGLISAGLVNSESVFANPVLPWLMAAIGLQLPFDGLASINTAVAQRRLTMNKLVALEVSRQIFTMIVTISGAASGLGVWALVIGTVSGSVFNAVVSHIVFPKPAMGFQIVREHFDEIFHFGKWLIIASLFGFILNRGDQVLFGWMMHKQSFSLYAVASIWVVAGMSIIQTMIGRIFYPAFAEVMRDTPEKFGALYKKARMLLDAGVVSIAYGAFFFAEPVFALIYPDNYANVGYYVKLLAPTLLFLPFRLINIGTLASGDSKGFTAVTVIGGVAMLVLVPTATHFLSEKAAILTYASIGMFTLPTIWRLGRKLMKLDMLVEGRMIVAAAALVIMLMIWA